MNGKMRFAIGMALCWAVGGSIGCGRQEAAPSTTSTQVSSGWFHWAAIADLHLIDSLYRGPENSPLDSESIWRTEERLRAVRETLSRPELSLSLLGVAGDIVHEYPSADEGFYKGKTAQKPAIATAGEILGGFPMPVHLALGNHDYDRRKFPPAFTHELFRTALGAEPYHAFVHRGFRFVFLDSMLGDSDETDSDVGALGAVQLAWLRGELDQGEPAILILHHALWQMSADPGFLPLLAEHAAQIRLVISGHLHRWFDWKDRYGPRAINIGSTRYDQDAYLLVACNEETGEVELLNQDQIHWMTLESDPY